MSASRVWSAIERVNERISDGANLLGISVAFLLAFLLSTDVAGRYFLNKPLTGVYEIAQSALVVIAFFGFSYTQRYRRHIHVEVVVEHFSPRTRETLGIFSYIVGLFFFGTILWMSWDVAWSSWLSKEWYEGILRLPVYPTKFGVVIGTALLCLQFVVDMVNGMIKLLKKGSESSPQ